MNIKWEEVEKAARAFADKDEFSCGGMDYLDIQDAFEKGAEWVLNKIESGSQPGEKKD